MLSINSFSTERKKNIYKYVLKQNSDVIYIETLIFISYFYFIFAVNTGHGRRNKNQILFI